MYATLDSITEESVDIKERKQRSKYINENGELCLALGEDTMETEEL